MNLTDAQRDEIRQAVIDMALADDDYDPDGKHAESHADRVVWWLEHKAIIEDTDPDSWVEVSRPGGAA